MLTPWYDQAAERIESAAAEAAEIDNWSVDDAAAVIGVETAWLAGLLMSAKFLLGGLLMEHRRVRRHRRTSG